MSGRKDELEVKTERHCCREKVAHLISEKPMKELRGFAKEVIIDKLMR